MIEVIIGLSLAIVGVSIYNEVTSKQPFNPLETKG